MDVGRKWLRTAVSWYWRMSGDGMSIEDGINSVIVEQCHTMRLRVLPGWIHKE